MGLPAKKALPPRHRVLAQWMLANPMASKSQAAEAFGVSVSWVSIVSRQEAFLEYIEGLNQAIESEIVVPMRVRLENVAIRSLEKLELAVEESNDPRFLLEVADKTLHRLGFAPSKGPAPPTVTLQQNNVYTAPADVLRAARERMHDAAFEQTHPPSGTQRQLTNEPAPTQPLSVPSPEKTQADSK